MRYARRKIHRSKVQADEEHRLVMAERFMSDPRQVDTRRYQ